MDCFRLEVELRSAVCHLLNDIFNPTELLHKQRKTENAKDLDDFLSMTFSDFTHDDSDVLHEVLGLLAVHM